MLIHGMLAGEKIFSAERTGYLQEIDALRSTIGRIQQIEAENATLKGELQEARQRNRERSKVRDGDENYAAKRSSATFGADAKT